MKNIILSLLIALTVSACSSGSTIADTPFNITGLFEGVYETNASANNNDVRTSGRFTLNIFEDNTGDLSGNILFANDRNAIDNGCIFNGQITGATNGFSIALTVEVPDGTTIIVFDDDGEASAEPINNGEVIYQLTQSNSGNTLTGTYTSSNLLECSNFSGSGTVTINRI